MLSYAEFYKPKFFLLENVLGLLSHKLQINKPGPQEGESVANGIIKFILRALTSLGYVVVTPSLRVPATDASGQLSGPL
jgi:DNA (cytosine-5)-methyltransferase 1